MGGRAARRRRRRLIEQTFLVLDASRLLDVAYATMRPEHRDRTRALAEGLRRLGVLATTIAIPPLPQRRNRAP
jgi:hypothetical protein